jgi:hypothetical protein
MAADGLPVQVACRMLQVSESGYYAALVAAPSERTIRHAWLTDVIVKIHADSCDRSWRQLSTSSTASSSAPHATSCR